MKYIVITLLVAVLLMEAIGLVYAAIVIDELKSDNRVYKELYKACEADRMWNEMQIFDLKAAESNNGV